LLNQDLFYGRHARQVAGAQAFSKTFRRGMDYYVGLSKISFYYCRAGHCFNNVFIWVRVST
jgi:hypothetical protein